MKKQDSRPSREGEKESFFVSLQKKGKKRNIASGPFISRMMPQEKRRER